MGAARELWYRLVNAVALLLVALIVAVFCATHWALWKVRRYEAGRF